MNGPLANVKCWVTYDPFANEDAPRMHCLSPKTKVNTKETALGRIPVISPFEGNLGNKVCMWRFYFI